MKLSNCCGARVEYIDEYTMTSICSECKDGCEYEEENESEFTLNKMD